MKREAISLNSILDDIDRRDARVSIVILDACRDNPFRKRSGRSVGGSRGLAAVNAPQGTFIMYSADAGEQALDRLDDDDSSPNSVFTRTLIPLLERPGLDIVQTAREVRRQVRRLASTIGHEQTPAYYDAVLGDFYFSGRVGPASTLPSLPPTESSRTFQQPSACAGGLIASVGVTYLLSAARERCLKPGDTFRDCEYCPEMVLIPAGSFTGAVAKLVGIECGVVSGCFNPNKSSVDAPDRRPRHDEDYHEA